MPTAVKMEPEDTIAPDGGHNHRAPQRFKKMSELLNLYEKTIEVRGTRSSWMAIVNQYDRKPYRGDDGQVLPNWGTLRYKVDQAITTYVDFATERKVWAKIETDEGVDTGNSPQWSDHITEAFHRYCIKKWEKRVSEIMMSVKDMLLFSKGVFYFPSSCECYPESIGAEHVWPDRNAGMFADSFDVLFIQKRFTAVELFRLVDKAEEYDLEGWRKDSVLRMISVQGALKDANFDSLYLQYKEGALSQTIADSTFDLVIAYVKEYHVQEEDDEDGEYMGSFGISQFVFPSKAHVPQVSGSINTDKASDRLGYLFYRPFCYEDMCQVLAVTAHTVCRNFYEDPSFAQLLYTASKTYDHVINRVLMAIEDNMRLIIKAESTEKLKKLQRMQWRNFMILEPGMELPQERIQRPVMDAMNVINKIGIDLNAGIGQYTINESAHGGQPKTATQAEYDFGESTRMSSAHLKVFNSYIRFLIREVYRRWTTCMKKYSTGYGNFQKFKAYLKKKKVPDSAWHPDNCSVESVLSVGAGSPGAKLQASRSIREALSVAARTPGEREAQRLMISAVAGQENVSTFIPDDENLAIQEDSLIGLENDSLSLPNANPANIRVLPSHLHFRHIPMHVQDARSSLQVADGLYQNIQNFPKDDEGIYLKTIADILIGVDNKLAHAQAHIMIAGEESNATKQQELRSFAQEIQEINKDQDGLEKIISGIQQKRVEESREKDAANPELDHKRKMYALDEEHAATMLSFDAQKAMSKGEQLRNQSAANAAHKRNLDTASTVKKLQLEEAKAGSDIKINRAKAQSNAGKA